MKNLKLAATILCAVSLIFNTVGEVGEGAKLAATTHSQKQVYKKVSEDDDHLEYRIVHREPELISSEAIKAPKPKPVAVKVINVLATGYTAGVESTGKRPGDKAYGITKSGVQVHRGKYSTVAADTRIFPIGTVLDIPGYGLGVVADTGSAIKGYKIDLFFDTIEDVYNEWGKKNADVKVLKWGNGKLSQDEFNKLNEV